MTIQEAILSELRKKPLSPFELSIILDKHPNSIASRVSELKKKGYRIETVPEEIKRYHFISNPPTIPERIIAWLSLNKAFGRDIKFSFLAKQLNLSEPEVTEAYQELFKTHQVIQTSKSSAKILKKRNH